MTTTIIPTVKEQARRFSSARSKKATDEPGRETLDSRDLSILGRVGRSVFARTKDGRELKVRGPARPDQLDQAPANAVLVRQLARAADGRPRTDVYIGTMVEPGTFEKLQRKKTYRPKERRPGPLDGLAELRKPDDRRYVQLVPDDDGSPKAIIMGALSKRPGQLWTDSRPMPMTVRRLIEVANADGANLRHLDGFSLADWTHAGRWRPLLVAAWPLVDAHLAGMPLRCAYEHENEAPLADTLDPAGVPVCNACVGWEPDAA